MDEGFELRHLGTVPYAEALELQRTLVEQRKRDEIPDTLLLLEHPAVITFGSRGQHAHVLDRVGVELHEDVGRGGDVTYHGPGQRVGYPIVKLPEPRRDLHRYLRALEQALIDVLAALGQQGERVASRTGVWVGGAKVAAIGIRASRWVTSHGFALNLDRRVHEGFRRIVPCGIADAQVTSLEDLLGEVPDTVEIDQLLVQALVEAIGGRGDP